MDLRIELQAKNNPLWKAIHKEHKNVAHFCTQHGTVEEQVGRLINLKDHPLNRQNGKWRQVCVRLSEITGILIENLFPLHIYEILESFRAIEFQSFEDLGAPEKPLLLTYDGDGEKKVEKNDASRVIGDVLKSLTYKERTILELRWGLMDSQYYTLEETGRILNITRERVRQIEAKAMRKLQRDNRISRLKGLVPECWMESP